MATVAHGRTSSNNQRGTVGLSAGDYIRLKRLQGARNYAATIADNTDVDVPTVPQTAYSVPFLKAKHTGSSRIRRTNEQWINYRASQTADVMQIANFDPCQYPRVPLPIRLCNCVDNDIEPGPKVAGGKCCVYKAPGGDIVPGTDNTVCQSEGDFKLYTFVPPVSTGYTISLFSVDYSDPDLFVSYPDGHLDTAYIAAEDDGGPSALYENTYGGDSIITGYFEAGKVYEVMALQYSGTCFRITVQ